MVENIVRKGEIACYKQFLLFSQCFPKLYLFAALCGNGLRYIGQNACKLKMYDNTIRYIIIFR